MTIKKPRKRKGTIEEQEQRDKFTALRSFLRRCWIKWPERLAAMREHRRAYIGTDKRIKWEHQCQVCYNWFVWRKKEMQIDHIVPCGTFLCDDDYKTFIPALFCDRKNLQKICKICHDKKTAEERKGK